jgi:preprotein translocase subunit SecD
VDLKKRHGNALQLGLDLAGGMSVVIQADMEILAERLGRELTAADREDAMQRAVEVLNSRIDQFGLTEPVFAGRARIRSMSKSLGPQIRSGSTPLSWARVTWLSISLDSKPALPSIRIWRPIPSGSTRGL